MRAWFAGEFELCLELCETARIPDADTSARVTLLRARALLRLRRPGDDARAKAELERMFPLDGSGDVSLSAQMLLGAAEIHLGEVATGTARLERARARSVSAHPTIRSEIAYRLGRARYSSGDLDGAAELLRDVDGESDIIAARAPYLVGWIETRRGNLDASIAAFRTALTRLDACRQQDRGLEASAVQALAYLAAERFDANAWSFVEERAARIDWSADGLAESRWWIAMQGVLVHEAAGDLLRALAESRRAVVSAPSPALRALALARRSAIARGAGDTAVPFDLLQAALETFAALDPAALRGDERTVPLALAEECALMSLDVDSPELAERARELVVFFRRVAPTDGTLAMADDPRARAWERMVEAEVAHALGDTARAADAYAAALAAFDALGYARRSALCAYMLGEITGFDRYYAIAVERTRATSSAFWLRRYLRRRERLYEEPIARALPAWQREVLALVIEGKTNAEIARARGVSESTVKKAVTALLRAFEVDARERLIIEAARRRIG
jgi:DNA-binding NarL/FixJ family response regulator